MLKVVTVISMWSGWRWAACLLCVACTPAAWAGPDGIGAGRTSEAGPRELYLALNALRIDGERVYYVKNLRLRRDAARLSLAEGKLAFLPALDGRVTGAVFTGEGRALCLPRDSAEKGQLARFLGEPLLDQGFSSAYLRFTDDAGEDLLAQLREAGVKPVAEPAFAEAWNPVIANLNSWHSVRILSDWLADEPRPYFYAGMAGGTLGPFDVLVDSRRHEQVLVGQPRWVQGERFYDVWASFSIASEPAYVQPFLAVSYAIETTIRPDRALEGPTTLAFQAARSGERVISLELSRFLSAQSVADAKGHPLVFFQNEAVNRHEIGQRGDDSLVVVLPGAPKAGELLHLRIAYRGNVISDAGNGVYFVGDRGSWYPHVGGTASFATFDLTFHWPHKLQLVATGKKLEEHEEGETHVGRWRSDAPIPVAGFNLGDYAVHTVDAVSPKIALYVNRQFERAIAERFHRPILPPPAPPPIGRLPRSAFPPVAVIPEMPPSPVALLKQLGLDIAEAVRFCARFAGPFPYGRLEVSQIPGDFGQGWPGLIYLSTFSFLSPASQQRAGLSTRAQEHFTEIVPYHEVAHQWWGNLTGWSSYRDQWISEGLANYIALLYADSKKPSDHVLAGWLGRYRDALVTKEPGQDAPAGEAGPLVMGYRLRSSRSPRAYERVLYGKGSWVFHMLRMMLRDPAAKDPDARFVQLLRGLTETYRFRALTTDDLQRAVEGIMTPAMALEGGRSMDWFFDQWVRASDIPRYKVEFTARPHGDAFLVRGTLKQRDVPETFIAPVPLYATRPGGKPVLLGTVVASGPATPFQFITPVRPKRLLIDPQLTLLCLTQ